MDSEEIKELEHLRRIGKSETDEGPYYHESWWESYKGGVKGVLGGFIIGAVAGLAMGAITTGLLAGVVGISMGIAGAAAVTLGFSGLGAVLGAHKFGQIGIVTGAVSAAQEKAEQRMKAFEDSRFVEIKREIAGLRAALAGHTDEEIDQIMSKIEPEVLSTEKIIEQHDQYRTVHCDEEHCEPSTSPAFWKVALIGGAVGTAAGALLGATDMFGEFLHPLHESLGDLSTGQVIGASAIVGGAVGSSFGINRDLFRRVFDVTDRMFKGKIPGIDEPHITRSTQSLGMHIPGQSCGTEYAMEDSPCQQKEGQTYFQDRLRSESAQKALQELDPNTAIRH